MGFAMGLPVVVLSGQQRGRCRVGFATFAGRAFAAFTLAIAATAAATASTAFAFTRQHRPPAQGLRSGTGLRRFR